MLKRIIGIIFFIIVYVFTNCSFAVPGYFYPKEYNITINNIDKKDIQEIEIFTPWGDKDEEDTVEIDARLFNYNNQYYSGTEGKEYYGIRCKILETIKNNDINEIKNGISFKVDGGEEKYGFSLKVCLKNGKQLYTDGIYCYTIFDEFSSIEEIKEAEKIEKETVYFEGNYITDDTWIIMEEKEKSASIAITENIECISKVLLAFIIGIISL